MRSRTTLMAVIMAVMMAVTPLATAQASAWDWITQVFGGQTVARVQSPSVDGTGSGLSILNTLLGLLVGRVLGQPSAAVATPVGGTASAPGEKQVVGFFAEWSATDQESFDSLKANGQAMDGVIPFWGTLLSEGGLRDRGGQDHDAVIRYAHEHNKKVYLMVNNEKAGVSTTPVHTLLNDVQRRTHAIDQLQAWIQKHHADGVNIDFEDVAPGDREQLTQFMRELYARLHPQGYTVSIDVFPKTDESNDMSIAYDYAQLPLYSDQIMIMMYDQHGAWSGPGPIASVTWVDATLKYALRFIPKSKLLLGIAGYGYDWSSGDTQDLTHQQAVDRAAVYGARIEWDDHAKTAHYSYTDKQGVGHQVWFENGRSLTYKLDLVDKYGLAGVALWKLGQEDPQYWDTFTKRLR